MATKQPKNPIIHDDAEMTIKVIDSGVEDTPATGDSVKIGVSHVECIKGILHCEEQIKMQRETIVELRKKLVEELKLDAGFISELISVVKQPTPRRVVGLSKRRPRFWMRRSKQWFFTRTLNCALLSWLLSKALSKMATAIRRSSQWPKGSALHCEILRQRRGIFFIGADIFGQHCPTFYIQTLQQVDQTIGNAFTF